MIMSYKSNDGDRGRTSMLFSSAYASWHRLNHFYMTKRMHKRDCWMNYLDSIKLANTPSTCFSTTEVRVFTTASANPESAAPAYI